MSNGRLKSFIERIENLESQKKDISGDIRDVYNEAKGEGFDTKILRKVISLRRKSKIERETEESMVETYLTAVEGAKLDEVSS